MSEERLFRPGPSTFFDESNCFARNPVRMRGVVFALKNVHLQAMSRFWGSVDLWPARSVLVCRGRHTNIGLPPDVGALSV